MLYLLCVYVCVDAYWENSEILFLYTGNEGPIDSFYNNSGLVFELAQKFSALVVFVEHVSDITDVMCW